MKIMFYDNKAQCAVIQVSPEIRGSTRNDGDKVHLDLKRHMVKDIINVIYCPEYDHMSGSNYCKNDMVHLWR